MCVLRGGGCACTHTHTCTTHTHLVAHDRDFDNMYERLKALQGQLAAAKTDLETRVTELENER